MKRFIFLSVIIISILSNKIIVKAKSIEDISLSVGIPTALEINYEEAINLYNLNKWKEEYKEYKIPKYKGFKSYESFTLFGKKTKQYKLQKLCHTSKDGLRMYKSRYCVAIGTKFNANIGQYFDLILKNGTIIPCVVADVKSKRHTDKKRIFTKKTKCCSEFVIDKTQIKKTVKKYGDVSYLKKSFNSPVIKIKIYKKNAMEG